MKAEYMRMLTIAAVAVVVMYVVSHYGGEFAGKLGLTPVA